MNDVFLEEILQLLDSEHSSTSLRPEQIQVNAINMESLSSDEQ